MFCPPAAVSYTHLDVYKRQFLNHRVDTALMGELADEFAKYFDVKNITMVLTAEASGIALATVCAERYGVPMVFAKKAKSDNIEGGLYQSEIFSYTYKKKVTLIVAQEWICLLYTSAIRLASGAETPPEAKALVDKPAARRYNKKTIVHRIKAMMGRVPVFGPRKRVRQR